MKIKSVGLDALLYICNYIIAVVPSSHLRHLFYRRVMKINMAKGVYIMSGAWIDTRSNFIIGRNSVINQRCRLDNRGGLIIGDNVSISPEVHLITAEHDIQDVKNFCGVNEPIQIGDWAFIGSRAIILPGVNLGKRCVVAAGAVVTKDVPDNAIVAGVPAKPIGTREKVEYQLNYRRHFI